MLINISEILNTGKSMKFSLKKSLTKPYSILSEVLQKIPAESIATQKIDITETLFIFLIKYIKIPKRARMEKAIRNAPEFCNMLNAAPVFCT